MDLKTFRDYDAVHKIVALDLNYVDYFIEHRPKTGTLVKSKYIDFRSKFSIDVVTRMSENFKKFYYYEEGLTKYKINLDRVVAVDQGDKNLFIKFKGGNELIIFKSQELLNLFFKN